MIILVYFEVNNVSNQISVTGIDIKYYVGVNETIQVDLDLFAKINVIRDI